MNEDQKEQLTLKIATTALELLGFGALVYIDLKIGLCMIAIIWGRNISRHQFVTRKTLAGLIGAIDPKYKSHR